MADIVDIIRKKYDIDIKNINILKLYKIEEAKISEDELEEKIAKCRKKWQQSINGANERFAERDRVYLNKADSFEKILRDSKLRQALYSYYNKSYDNGATEVAKDFFGIINGSANIRKEQVEFYFAYFPEQRKNKKAILEMLKTDLKVKVVDDSLDETEEVQQLEGKKKESSVFVVNLFQKATIMNLRKCEILFEKASTSDVVYSKFPAVRESMYSLLGLDKIETLAEFSQYVKQMSDQTAQLKYEWGQDYGSLLDFYNNLSNILEYRDVVDNFEEFKLLLKYPKLTPYMYLFENMKQNTLNKFCEVASGYYGFRNMTDFVLSYFSIIYDNFGISEQAIKHILKDAEKKKGQKKVLDQIDKTFGKSAKRQVPKGVKVVHALCYWPLYFLLVFFYGIKFVVNNIRYFSVIALVAMARFMAGKGRWFFGADYDAWADGYSLEAFKEFVIRLTEVENSNGTAMLFANLYTGLYFIVFIFLPALAVAFFVWSSGNYLTKKYDWGGIERTICLFLELAKKRTEEKLADYGKNFWRKRLLNILLNVLCVVALGIAIFFWAK